MEQNKIKGQTKYGIVYADGSALSPNGLHWSRDDMKKNIREYSGVNRIHKPLFLLYYQAVMAGKAKHWT